MATRRVSKFFTIAVGIVTVAVLTSSAAITNWLARGEGTSQLYRPERTDQFLGSSSRLPAQQVPGDFRLRAVERYV